MIAVHIADNHLSNHHKILEDLRQYLRTYRDTSKGCIFIQDDLCILLQTETRITWIVQYAYQYHVPQVRKLYTYCTHVLNTPQIAQYTSENMYVCILFDEVETCAQDMAPFKKNVPYLKLNVFVHEEKLDNFDNELGLIKPQLKSNHFLSSIQILLEKLS